MAKARPVGVARDVWCRHVQRTRGPLEWAVTYPAVSQVRSLVSSSTPPTNPQEVLHLPAFVFPGQGSQRPGMGRPWQDHPSWEVIEDASQAAGRDVGHLLLARVGRRAHRDPQRAARHVHSEPRDPRRGRAGRHRANEHRGPLPRRVHRARSRRDSRIRGVREDRGRAGRGHAGCRRRPPRRDDRGRGDATRRPWTSRAAWPTARCGSPT